MPYSNNGGPWGGGGNGGGDDKKGGGKGPWGGGGRGPGGQPPVPDIDEIVRKGQEQLKILMGGRGGAGRGRGQAGGGGMGLGRRGLLIAAALLVGFWLLMSVYTVRPEEQSVELTFGECRGDCIGNPGLNFAPWPIVTHEIVQVTRENIEDIGSGTVRGDQRRPDADRRREHRRHHLPGDLERPRPHRVPVQPLGPDLDDSGGRRVGDARGGLALGAVADPEPRPRHHQPGGAAADPADARRVRLGGSHRAGELRQGRSAFRGDRRLPGSAGGAAGALDAAEPGRRLRQPDARRGARQRGSAPAGGRGLPRPGGQRRAGRGEPLHRRAPGVREGARCHAAAALSRGDGKRARRRADVPPRHAFGATGRGWCPICR